MSLGLKHGVHVLMLMIMDMTSSVTMILIHCDNVFAHAYDDGSGDDDAWLKMLFGQYFVIP